MRFGTFYLPTFDHNEDGSEGEMFERIQNQVELADELGFDGAWFAEHHFQAHGGILSVPQLLIAALTSRTKQIRFGLGVVQVPYHHPLSIAENIATLDQISKGRLEIGLGRAFLKCEYDGFGIPMNESRSRFYEGCEVIFDVLQGNNKKHEGRYFNFPELTLYPRPFQKPMPPVWVAAATTPETFEWIGKNGFNLMIMPLLSPSFEELIEKIEIYRTARKKEQLGPGEILINIHVHVSHSLERAKQESEEALNRYVRKTQEAGKSAIASFMKDGIPEDFKRYPEIGRGWSFFTYDKAVEHATVIAGTTELCLEKLISLKERLDFTYFAGTFDFGQEYHSVLESMRLFSEQIIPAFNKRMARTYGLYHVL